MITQTRCGCYHNEKLQGHERGHETRVQSVGRPGYYRSLMSVDKGLQFFFSLLQGPLVSVCC